MRLAKHITQLERRLDQRRRGRDQLFYPGVCTTLESELDSEIRVTRARLYHIAGNACDRDPLLLPYRGDYPELLKRLNPVEREQAADLLRQLDVLAAEYEAAHSEKRLGAALMPG